MFARLAKCFAGPQSSQIRAWKSDNAGSEGVCLSADSNCPLQNVDGGLQKRTSKHVFFHFLVYWCAAGYNSNHSEQSRMNVPVEQRYYTMLNFKADQQVVKTVV